MNQYFRATGQHLSVLQMMVRSISESRFLLAALIMGVMGLLIWGSGIAAPLLAYLPGLLQGLITVPVTASMTAVLTATVMGFLTITLTAAYEFLLLPVRIVATVVRNMRVARLR